MATVTPVRDDRKNPNVILFTWTLNAGDVGVPVEVYDYADCTIQFSGTFAGSTAVLEGSNDGSVYGTLNDVQLSPISKTANALSQVAECCRFMRPSVSGGAAAGLVATLYGRRAR